MSKTSRFPLTNNAFHEQMKPSELYSSSLHVEDREYKLWPISDVHLEFYCKNVCPTRIPFKRCPCCAKALDNFYTYAIGISDEFCVKSGGVICYDCDTFYSTDCELFAELEKIRIKKSDYKLIADYMCTFEHDRYGKLLNTIKSACRQFDICRVGEYRTYTFVTDMKDRDPANNVFHYTEEISLKVMTAYILGKFKWILEGKDFFFVDDRVRFNQQYNYLPYISPSTPVVIQTKSNGGLFDHNKDLVLVDALAFFPSVEMLIPIRATYDRKNRMYYIDRRLLEKYALQFGLIFCKYVSGRSKGWENLREESLLHQLGYNVSQTDGLSSDQRQHILSMIMEAGIMKPSQIITLLKGFISRNGNQLGNELAREKWEEDLEYIFNYGTKTKGFVIGTLHDL